MKIVRAIVLLLMYIVPATVVVLSALFINTQMTILLAFVFAPLPILATSTLIKNKIHYGKFIPVNEKKTSTNKIDGGFECQYCGARFSFDRKTCPDCGKTLR